MIYYFKNIIFLAEKERKLRVSTCVGSESEERSATPSRFLSHCNSFRELNSQHSLDLIILQSHWLGLALKMESASELVEFPLLLTPIDSHYRACTIPYRFPSDNPRKPTPTEISWIDLFLNSIPSFKFVLSPSPFFFSLKNILFLYPIRSVSSLSPYPFARSARQCLLFVKNYFFSLLQIVNKNGSFYILLRILWYLIV